MVKGIVDVTSIDHFAVSNDVEIKLIRDDDGEVAVIFAIEDTIVSLSPVGQLLSYLSHEILNEAESYLSKEEPKPGWREKNA